MVRGNDREIETDDEHKTELALQSGDEDYATREQMVVSRRALNVKWKRAWNKVIYFRVDSTYKTRYAVLMQLAVLWLRNLYVLPVT